MEAQARRLHHAHADPRRVGRRASSSSSTDARCVAARHLQSDHAPASRATRRYTLTRGEGHAVGHRIHVDVRRSREFKCSRRSAAATRSAVAQLYRQVVDDARRAMTRRVRFAGLVLVAALARLASGAAAGDRPPAKIDAVQLQQRPRSPATACPGIGQVTFWRRQRRDPLPAAEHRLHGDSAERYPDRDLTGRDTSSYDEPRFHVTSDFLNYFPDDERVVAVGNVHARLPSGSTLVGPHGRVQARRPADSPARADDAPSRARRSRSSQKDSTGQAGAADDRHRRQRVHGRRQPDLRRRTGRSSRARDISRATRAIRRSSIRGRRRCG